MVAWLSFGLTIRQLGEDQSDRLLGRLVAVVYRDTDAILDLRILILAPDPIPFTLSQLSSPTIGQSDFQTWPEGVRGD